MEGTWNLTFILCYGSCVHSFWRNSIEWRDFFFFFFTSYFLIFSITICLYVFGVRYKLFAIQLFNQQAVLECPSSAMPGAQRPKCILSQEFIPRKVFYSKWLLEPHFPISAGQRRYWLQHHVIVDFSKVLRNGSIFSFTLEEIVTLHLKFIHILPNFCTKTLICLSKDPLLQPISVVGCGK